MSLLSDIADGSHITRDRCTIAKALDSLPPDEAADLRVAIADERYLAPAISKALRSRNLHIGEGTVRRHRRGDCQCPTS